MKIKSFFRDIFKEFKRRWGQYLVVIFLPTIVVNYGLLILFQWLGEQILTAFGIPYFSHSTFMMFLQQPLSILLLLLLFVVLILVVFFQFCFGLLGIRQIRNNRLRFGSLLKESWSTTVHSGFRSIPGLLLYFIVLLPNPGLLPYSTLLAKADIPVFILEFIIGKPVMLIPLLIVFAVLTYFAIRWIHMLPLLILEKKKLKEAYKLSSQITKGHRWKILLIILILTLISMVPGTAINYGLYGLQTLFDKGDPTIAMTTSVIMMVLMFIISEVLLIITTVYSLFLIIPPQSLNTEPANDADIRTESSGNQEADADTAQKPEESTGGKHPGRGSKVAVCVFCAIVLVLMTVYSVIFMNVHYEPNVKVISHKGLDYDNETGVQNAVSTMLNTMEISKPDYVEMDIHETKDNQFIVFHDESLKALCGIDGVPHDYTLAELMEFTAEENGESAKLDSFDNYLQAANEAGQKLLIEIKTTPYDSPDMLDRFIEQYGETIFAYDHLIQTMDYDAVRDLVGGFGADQTQPIKSVQAYQAYRDEILAELPAEEVEALSDLVKDNIFFVSAIVPYNLIYAGTGGSAVTMETTFVDQRLLDRVHELGQEVYVWTINDAVSMESLITLGVDGIITDRPALLREIIHDFEDSAPYATKLRLFMDNLTTLK